MDQFEKEENQTILEQKVILIKHFLDEAVKCFGEKEFQEALEQCIVVITLVREMIVVVNKERFWQREAITLEEAQRKVPLRHVMWYELKEKYLPRTKQLLEEMQQNLQEKATCKEKGTVTTLHETINGGLREQLELLKDIIADREEVRLQRQNKNGLPASRIPAMSIAELDLSLRAENCLRRVGIETVDQLTKTSAEELKKVRNFGAKCLQEVLEKLAARNLSLRKE